MFGCCCSGHANGCICGAVPKVIRCQQLSICYKSRQLHVYDNSCHVSFIHFGEDISNCCSIGIGVLQCAVFTLLFAPDSLPPFLRIICHCFLCFNCVHIWPGFVDDISCSHQSSKSCPIFNRGDLYSCSRVATLPGRNFCPRKGPQKPYCKDRCRRPHALPARCLFLSCQILSTAKFLNTSWKCKI